MKDRTRGEFLKDGLAVTAGVVASGVLGNTGTANSASSVEGGKKSSPLENKANRRPNIVLISSGRPSIGRTGGSRRTCPPWPACKTTA